MNKIAIARAKISNALFSNFGEQGLLVKKDLSEYTIFLIKQDKSFHLKEGFTVESKDIKIKSDEKPHIGDKLSINGNEMLIKASPSHLGNGIYSVKVK